MDSLNPRMRCNTSHLCQITTFTEICFETGCCIFSLISMNHNDCRNIIYGARRRGDAVECQSCTKSFLALKAVSSSVAKPLYKDVETLLSGNRQQNLSWPSKLFHRALRSLCVIKISSAEEDTRTAGNDIHVVQQEQQCQSPRLPSYSKSTAPTTIDLSSGPILTLWRWHIKVLGRSCTVVGICTVVAEFAFVPTIILKAAHS